MLQPIATVPLSDGTISQLRENGFSYVEDIRDATAESSMCSHAIQEAQKLFKVTPSRPALDILREELQRYKISTLSRELNKVLDGGFRCKAVTELCGAPGSGRTQICLQLCITVQLSKKHNGLEGEVLYIDTRSRMSILRLKGKKFIQTWLKSHVDYFIKQQDENHSHLLDYRYKTDEQFLFVDNGIIACTSK